MALQLSAVIDAVRNRHAAFHKSRVTNVVLAGFLSDYQNQLIGKCAERDKLYLRQSVAIAVNLTDANDPGTAGVGTSGGLPASASEGPDQVDVIQESAGALVEVRTPTDGGMAMVNERPVTAAGSTSVSSTGAGRTTDEDIGRLVHIVAGRGRGQMREVVSNTGEQWVISTGSDGKEWATTPDTTSVLEVLEPQLVVDEDVGVITELPAQSSRTGYLVRLNAQGLPYIDYTAPLTVWVDRGIPLPAMLAIHGGTVRYTNQGQDELTVTSYGRRLETQLTPAIYVAGETVHLCGTEDDWRDVESIEVVYTPVAPVFTGLREYFLLPDATRSCLATAGAAFCAGRLDGTDGLTLDVDRFDRAAAEAEQDYLNTLRLSKRARRTTMREGVY